MNETLKNSRPVRWWIVITGILFFAGILCYPLAWRLSVYKSIRHSIQLGLENKATHDVERLSTKWLFKADWTVMDSLPRWRWVYDLDAWLFGCPSCRANGTTLLQFAAGKGQKRLVNLLLAHGASVERFGDRGNGALMSAVMGGNTDVIATIIAKGADINSTNYFAGSILNVAVMASGISGINVPLEYLLTAGADPNIVSVRGQSALDIAELHYKPAIPLLISHGAKPAKEIRGLSGQDRNPADVKSIQMNRSSDSQPD